MVRQHIARVRERIDGLLGRSTHLRAQAVAVGLVVVHQVFSVACIDPSGLQEKLLGSTDGHEALPSNLQCVDSA